jgi:hypothetical protein
MWGTGAKGVCEQQKKTLEVCRAPFDITFYAAL